MAKLTKKQVAVFRRALTRRGRSLPKRGACVTIKASTGDALLCRLRDGFYFTGRSDRAARDRVRAGHVRAGKQYRRVRYDSKGLPY